MIDVNTIINLFELEGIEIKDGDKLRQELQEAISEHRFHIFKEGNKWQGFCTWLHKPDGVLLNNLLIFREYRGKVQLSKLRELFKGKSILWRDRKKKKVFRFNVRG